MRNIVIAGLPGSYLSSIGHLADSHTMLSELFSANEALGAYAKIQTQLEIVTAEGEPVRLAGGRQLAADGTWRAVRMPRLVFLPAFQLSQLEDAGDMLRRSAAMHQWLRGLDSAETVIGASGASCLHLLAAGLIDNQPVSVPLRLFEPAQRLFPGLNVAPPDVITATAGKVMTCADRRLGAEFVARLMAEALSETSLRWLEIRQGLNSGRGGQSGLSGDSLVARAQLMLREQFTANITIGALSRRLSVSQHTLMRRFRKATGATPGQYRQQARIETASVMLRETDRTISEVGLLVGYSDARAFREAFVRTLGKTPSDYRRGHRRVSPE